MLTEELFRNSIYSNLFSSSVCAENEPEEKKTQNEVKIEVKNIDGLLFLKQLKNDTVDLILTDPPYIISKDTGMNSFYNMIETNRENGIEFVKTEEEWEDYKVKNDIETDEKKITF